MYFSGKQKILITCARGIVPYLQAELESLGYKIESSHNTGVEVIGTWEDILRLNFCLRTAFCVLILLKQFTCRDTGELYREVKELPWEELITPDQYLTVIARSDTSSIDNPVFLSQKTKDAIVDRIFSAHGRRPFSGPDRNKVVINVYWKDDFCWVYLNTSGEKLADRGYRRIPHKAPLQETLAAGVIMSTGYAGACPLVNPMCGSGTLAIEAALIALNRAPGLLRSNFGFTHIKNFNKAQADVLRGQLRDRAEKTLPYRIIASDIDPKAVEAAKKNARTAGVDNFIEFKICDFSDTPVPEDTGIVIMNPAYGLRMGNEKKLEKLYGRIGDFLKNKCAGYKGYVFTGNLSLAKQIGLKTSRRIIFFNARIECRLLEYELYTGSRRTGYS